MNIGTCAPDLHTEINSETKPRRTPAKFRHSILLIDHDRESIDSSSRWFESIGYETSSSFHPFHGLTLAAERNFDVAVIDIQMLDTDGPEILQQLVDLQLFPVVVHTAEEDPELHKTAIEIGAVACFKKPASMVELTEMVESVCRN